VLNKEQQEKYTKLKASRSTFSQLQGPGRRGGAGQ